MIEVFSIVLSFGIGRWMGMQQARNQDVIKQTSYMQDLIDKAYQSRDEMKKQLVEAEEKAETWERRYENLVTLLPFEDEDV